MGTGQSHDGHSGWARPRQGRALGEGGEVMLAHTANATCCKCGETYTLRAAFPFTVSGEFLCCPDGTPLIRGEGFAIQRQQGGDKPCESYKQCRYCLNADTRRLKDPLELRGTSPYQYECHCCGAFWHWDHETNQRMLEKEKKCHADPQPSTPSETTSEETSSRT